MNKSEPHKETKWNQITKDIVIKFIFFYLGLYILNYGYQFNLAVEQISEYREELQVVLIIISITTIAAFSFYRFKLYKYSALTIIATIFVFLAIFFIFQTPEDIWKIFIKYKIYYVVLASIGGYFTTRAFIDPNKFREKLENYVDESVQKIYKLF